MAPRPPAAASRAGGGCSTPPLTSGLLALRDPQDGPPPGSTSDTGRRCPPRRRPSRRPEQVNVLLAQRDARLLADYDAGKAAQIGLGKLPLAHVDGDIRSGARTV